MAEVSAKRVGTVVAAVVALAAVAMATPVWWDLLSGKVVRHAYALDAEHDCCSGGPGECASAFAAVALLARVPSDGRERARIFMDHCAATWAWSDEPQHRICDIELSPEERAVLAEQLRGTHYARGLLGRHCPHARELLLAQLQDELATSCGEDHCLPQNLLLGPDEVRELYEGRDEEIFRWLAEQRALPDRWAVAFLAADQPWLLALLGGAHGEVAGRPSELVRRLARVTLEAADEERRAVAAVVLEVAGERSATPEEVAATPLAQRLVPDLAFDPVDLLCAEDRDRPLGHEAVGRVVDALVERRQLDEGLVRAGWREDDEGVLALACPEAVQAAMSHRFAAELPPECDAGCPALLSTMTSLRTEAVPRGAITRSALALMGDERTWQVAARVLALDRATYPATGLATVGSDHMFHQLDEGLPTEVDPELAEALDHLRPWILARPEDHPGRVWLEGIDAASPG